MRMHFRKGSLLEYNGVYLAEGPWPGKAKFDALRRARQRDASTFLDYGFNRPGVISQGPHAQFQAPSYGPAGGEPTPAFDGPAIQEAEPIEDPTNENGQPKQEVIPPPAGIQVTTAAAQAVPAAQPNVVSAIAAAPVTPSDNLIGLPTVMPAQLQTPLPAVPVGTQPVTQPVRDTTAAPQLHINPYRQEMKTWMESTTGGLPPDSAGVNPLRPDQTGQFTTSWTASQPAAADSPSERSSAQTARDTTVWPGTQR